jgi:UDP-N-acetylglucosamine--N-acetylmuramyl-(pentapeptide) pyrophosphoryl-undecaprenol N-acetylglucosamine transferase
MKKRTVIISGGGTGGHIYPALAVGRKLQERNGGLRLTFVGSRRSVEKDLMEKFRVDFIPMKIEGFKGKGLRVIKSGLLLPASFIKSLSILVRLRPDLVIGVGGFSSGPIVLLASWLRIPTLILEQNVLPGFTNRLLIRWVKIAVAAFQSSLPAFKGKGIYFGNPVREEFYSLPPKARDDKLTLLVFGGSQGSHFLNQAVTSTLPLLRGQKNSLRIFHQTGEKDYEMVRKIYLDNGFEDPVVAPYFYNMAAYFQKSDLVICRAGATTIAELIAAGKASLLFPFAQAADNHQVFNARELEKAQGAEIIEEKDFSPELLARKIQHLAEHGEDLDRMEKNLSVLKTERVAERIADLCFELMEQRA